MADSAKLLNQDRSCCSRILLLRIMNVEQFWILFLMNRHQAKKFWNRSAPKHPEATIK